MLIEIQKLTNLDSVSEGGSGAGAAQKKIRLRKKRNKKNQDMDYEKHGWIRRN